MKVGSIFIWSTALVISQPLLSLVGADCSASPLAGQSARESRPVASLRHFAEVHGIIEQIERLPPGRSSMIAEQALFDRLVGIGPDAVPAIVSLMDDRRPLPFPAIELANHAPDAFEGIRHYGPKLMVDALAAILNQLTGRDFGDIENGASEHERQATVEGWRSFVRARRRQHPTA